MNIKSITPLLFNIKTKTISQKPDNSPKTNSTELPKLYANQIYFTAGITTKSDRIIDNIKSIEKLFGEIFTPAKSKFIETFNNETLTLFNNFFNKECEKVILKTTTNTPTYALTKLEDNGSDFVIKLSKTELNNQKFLRLSYSKDAADPNILLISPTKICTEKEPEKYLTRDEILKTPSISMFDYGGEKIVDNLTNFKYFVGLQIANHPQEYFMTIFKNSLELITTLTNKLNSIEHTKKHALKRSYKGYMPFPRKTTFQLRNPRLADNTSYALLPHQERNNTFFRLLELDYNGEIKDAYLIHPEKGIVKNYCPQKKFNWASTSHTPPHPIFLNNEQYTKSNSIRILSKYYNLLNDFSDHINKTQTLSIKTLNEKYQAEDSLGYNSIRTLFLDKIPEILPNPEKNLTLKTNNGAEFILSKTQEYNFEVVKLICEHQDKLITTKINPKNAKLFQTNLNGEIILDKNQTPLYINSKSSAFKFKAKLMKDFIQEAQKAKNVDLNAELQSQLLDFKETFTTADEIWKNMSRTKKTDFMKIFPTIVEARGNTGEIRFQIPEKDYQLGFKPQKLTSSEFMRFSIYNKEGKLQKAFLINDFTKVVDNYCTKGYTKDSISRIPPNIVYKTEEQIKAENIDSLLAEYKEELSKFHTIAKDFAIDKRLR